MRLLALSSLILAGTLTSTAFADQNEPLNYNIINISAEASRDISNDLMHANLYVEKSNKQPVELAAQIIESTDFKAASQLIAELQQNFQTESINFTVSEAKRKKIENELMLEASKNFQQRAQSLAQAWNKAGYQLVNMNINTNNSGYPPVPRMAMAKAAYAEAAIPDQEMAAGESKMTVSANGSIQFK